MAQFKFTQKDKEDIRLTPADTEAYAKSSKANHHALLKLEKLGVAAKGVKEFLIAWKYR